MMPDVVIDPPDFTDSPASREDFDEWVLTPQGEQWLVELGEMCWEQLTAIRLEELCTDYELPPGPERDEKFRRCMQRAERHLGTEAVA